jgi:tRNA wybutosine-synthesizing protein 2
MNKTPLQLIKTKLKDCIPSELLDSIPNKWEKIGSVLIVKLHDSLYEYKQVIAKTYADVLQVETVLQDVGVIKGVFREPSMEVLFGEKNTVTVHNENNILFKFDPQKIMFSSGNIDERKRMASISNSDETVVDLFAGIGYFSLPMAVYSKPKKIISCEINPVSYEFLCKNIVLNHVTDIVDPLFGDNKNTAPKHSADRVIMGYLKNTQDFLPIAIHCLKKDGGIIHFHCLTSNQLNSQGYFDVVKKIALDHNCSSDLLKEKNIKSYAPGINHVVLDVRVEFL